MVREFVCTITNSDYLEDLGQYAYHVMLTQTSSDGDGIFMLILENNFVTVNKTESKKPVTMGTDVIMVDDLTADKLLNFKIDSERGNDIGSYEILKEEGSYTLRLSFENMDEEERD